MIGHITLNIIVTENTFYPKKNCPRTQHPAFIHSIFQCNWEKKLDSDTKMHSYPLIPFHSNAYDMIMLL
jgi:hypothetical protein